MKKRILQGLEKVVWIVLGGVLATLAQEWVQDRSPKIVVRQYYNTIETADVPKQVGSFEDL